MTALMNSKWLSGNLVFYDQANPSRWLDAFGPTVCKFLEDWVGTPFITVDSPGGWTVTLVETGAAESTIALIDGAGGLAYIITDAAENDGLSMQITSEAFKLVSGKPCYFGIRLSLEEVTQSDVLVGLCITDTTLLGGMTDGAYFRKVDGSAAVSFVLEKNSTETTGAVLTAVAATYYVLEFIFDGTNVDSFVDGVLQTRLAQTNLPDDEDLTPSIELLTGEAVRHSMTVDWIRAIQLN